MSDGSVFKLVGLSDQQKQFLYTYAQQVLGTKSRTKAILSLITNAMTSLPTQTLSINDQSKQPMLQDLSQAKKRIQLSLSPQHYILLSEVAKNTDSSIQHYIICMLLNNLYSDKIKLLGIEIEQLKKSNYELHKIGVNINQIAKALNAGEKQDENLLQLYEISNKINEHINIVKQLLK